MDEEVEVDEEDIDRLAVIAADSGDLIDVTTENEVKAYETVKQQQLDQLNILKESERIKLATDNKVDLGVRLNYLMKQSEVFSHFLSGANIKLLDNALPSSSSSSSSNSSSQKLSTQGDKSKPRGGRPKMSEHDEDVNLVKSIQDNTRVTWLEHQPSILVGGTLRAYQMEGLNWLIRLHDNNVNGILADEMGLGKTIQTIALLAYLKEFRNISGPHLVITPKSTITNWIKEFQKWCPEFRLIKLLGSKEERQVIVKEQMIPGSFDVVISSNESCVKEGSKLMKFKWRYIIIDEAHRIKNEKAVLSKFVRLLHTNFKLLMTGTPLQNNLKELWSLLNFILPDVFGDSTLFDSWFNTMDSVGTENVMKRLHMILKPFMLRRVKNDVEKDLLPKKEIKLFIGLTTLQREWYTRILCKDIEQLNTSVYATDRFKLLNILMQLRKCCNHPYLFDGAEIGPPYEDGPHIWENSGKMSVLHKLLPKLKKQGSRVLIFSQMTRMLDILEDYLLSQQYTYCRIDGSTDTQDRDIAMENFNTPNSDKFIFLLSTRAGGLGINLQTADTVILYDSDFNPQVDLQAMDRAHRIGQTKQVRVFRFITEKSVEEKMIERADRKLFLDAAVIQQGRFTEKTNQVTKGEMINMVRFGADEIMSAKDGTGILTDEDIDILLKKGEERTVSDMEKIKTEMQHNLANFSLGFIAENQMINLFTFEGEDYRGKTTKALLSSSSSSSSGTSGSGTAGEATAENSASSSSSSSSTTMFINLPQRERRRPFDVDTYFKMALKGQIFDPSDTSNTGNKLNYEKIKKKKPWTAPDYQFYDRSYFEQLQKKEESILEEKQKILAVIKDLKKRERKGLTKQRHREKKKSMKKSRKSSSSNSVKETSNKDTDGNRSDYDESESYEEEEDSEDDSDSEDEDYTDETTTTDNNNNNNNNNNNAPLRYKDPLEYGRQAQHLQEKIDAGDYDLSLPLKQEKECKKLEAFSDWNKADYKIFLDAVEKYGIQSACEKEMILQYVAQETNKTIENVSRYYETFFQRMSELNDYLKIKDRFAKADMARHKRILIQKSLEQKVTKAKNNAWQNIEINYYTDFQDLYFSRENDKILLESLYKRGYGNWDMIRQDIRNAPQFQFDWFIRSRSCADIQWRCDYLMKLIGNEIERSGVLQLHSSALAAAAVNTSSSGSLNNNNSSATGVSYKSINSGGGGSSSFTTSVDGKSNVKSIKAATTKSDLKYWSKETVPDSDDSDTNDKSKNNNSSDDEDDDNSSNNSGSDYDNEINDKDGNTNVPTAATTTSSFSGRKRSAVVLFTPGTSTDITTGAAVNNKSSHKKRSKK